jgi:hypothetical protein
MNLYLKELLKNPNIPLVCDYDGTLFEGRWFTRQISLFDMTESKLIEAMENEECLYSEPVNYMQNFLQQYGWGRPTYSLGYIHCDIDFGYKTGQIREYYPTIGRIIWAKTIDDKIMQLQAMLKQYGEFIYIDDSLDDLMYMEGIFKNSNCHFFHISSVIM